MGIEEFLLDQAYKKGYAIGYEIGFKEGYEIGLREGYEIGAKLAREQAIERIKLAVSKTTLSNAKLASLADIFELTDEEIAELSLNTAV